MNGFANRRRSNKTRWMAWLALFLCACCAPAGADCPRLLMFDGVDYRTQINPEQAAYWGRTVGVQGFFVNNAMAYWQVDVGTDPGSALWQALRRFQTLYAQYGVTDNFIKVALYKGHDWHDADQNAAVVEHFAHAAALARYAGLKGIALDLEPHQPAWGAGAGGPELAATVEQTGRAIGEAMHQAYPDMTLIVLPDVLLEAQRDRMFEQKLEAGMQWLAGRPNRLSNGGYGLAVPFVRGLLSVPWKHVVLATEQTYNGHIIPSMRQAEQQYAALLDAVPVKPEDFSVAPGLWPLGLSYGDKSGRKNPDEFERRLREAFGLAERYVWIYGKGSAWQTDGPYGKGPVAADFRQYVDAIHRVRMACAANGLP